MKFRKKPVVIEAVQWDGGNRNEVLAFGDVGGCPMRTTEDGIGIAIDTLEGTMVASIGDWIIRGVKGEFYPCKPDIFRSTYERVEEA